MNDSQTTGEKVVSSQPAAGTAADDHLPVPDEDGPHDVPDEKVIEKTLPSVPVSGSVGNGSAQTR